MFFDDVLTVDCLGLCWQQLRSVQHFYVPICISVLHAYQCKLSSLPQRPKVLPLHKKPLSSLLTFYSPIMSDRLLFYKALVLGFRLYFTKDSTTINTAGATVRQLVNAVYERVLTEDSVQSQGNSLKSTNYNHENLKCCWLLRFF